ncbi:MAG: hypothetical protein JWQ90_1936 [Hydrocarboniphaga sp.]|uniref:hypothetical protein n=1 Tax=Hydrocarboniphaga sp. TaxID=2033016 RepID=UPI0026097D2C|nr:hypothetical protein [Hydrocarboniphaga sp.]MDB5969486.1 hypothetical protein [Hydrocarboniphaga sp.]
MRSPRYTGSLLKTALMPCLGLLLASCASTGYADRVAFTDGLSSEYKLGSEQKRMLQYYVSDTIRLVRSASAGQTGIRDGRLVSSSSRDVDQVIIDGGTPGVVLASGPNWMAVSFDTGSYLYFVSRANRQTWLAEDYVDDQYYLYLPDFNGQAGTVRLGSTIYTATDDSFRAHLVIARESFSDVDARQARLPGRYLK